MKCVNVKTRRDLIGEPLLTTADVAAKLQVSEKLVRIWIAGGSLRGRKIGKAWRVSRAALDDFLAKGSTSGTL